MINQTSIKYPVGASGVGLHNGIPVTITLHPAKPGAGIVFRRVDLDPNVDFRVCPELVRETTLCTTLIKDGHKVRTVEHLMSALYGLGIDNILIEIDSFEVPILDGSASEFIFLLQSAGIQHYDKPKSFARILKRVEVRDEKGGCARLDPCNGFKLSFSIDFDHPTFREHNNYFTVDFSHTAFLKEVSRARTFGFLKDEDVLRSNNMALGGSVNNAIILDNQGPINAGGFRISGEPVKHKVLDAVGDLYVFGHYIVGSYTAHKSGHALNNKLLHALIAQKDSWEEVHYRDERDIPINFIQSKVA